MVHFPQTETYSTKENMVSLVYKLCSDSVALDSRHNLLAMKQNHWLLEFQLIDQAEVEFHLNWPSDA